MFARLSPDVRQYLLITGNYWAFTLTDGALRMLVVLHFHELGYSPLQVALLFLFYEIFGVITNLVGGWLGARIGLNKTMNIGLAMQVIALSMLLVPAAWLTVPWVMGAQALSGVAKDLNKMSAKSSIKLLVPGDQQGALYRWVAALTGSKNALKGVGFFLGGALLTAIGFKSAIAAMAIGLAVVWLLSLAMLKRDLGKAKAKPKFRDMFSKSRAINLLSAARLFLFGARDVWFVIALPVFLAQSLGWDFWQVGGFLAAWVIGYGIVQSIAPYFTGRRSGKVPDGRTAFGWAAALALIPAAMALALAQGQPPQMVLIAGSDGVRRAVCDQLVPAQLPHSQLRHRRRSVAGRRVLLHGQRIGPPARDDAVRMGVPGCRPGRMPDDFRCVRGPGRRDIPCVAHTQTGSNREAGLVSGHQRRQGRQAAVWPGMSAQARCAGPQLSGPRGANRLTAPAASERGMQQRSRSGQAYRRLNCPCWPHSCWPH